MVFLFQLVYHGAKSDDVVGGVHLLLVSDQNGVFLSPCLRPVNLFLRLLAGPVDDILDLLYVHVELDQVVQ